MQGIKASIEERFWEKVKKTETCWIWSAHRRGNYGRIGKGVTCRDVNAHRVSWEIHNGPIPKGMNVLHRCDNRPCVNPDHLFLGTQADNLNDCVLKGRHGDWRGEKNGRAKLTGKQVREIREKYLPKEVTASKLAKEYGVSRMHIYKILYRTNWKHI